MAGGNPVAQGKTHDSAPIDASRGPGIDVLDGGLRILQACLFQQALELAIIADVNFAVDQRRQALFETHRCHARLTQLLFQSRCEGVELQGAKLRQGSSTL